MTKKKTTKKNPINFSVIVFILLIIILLAGLILWTRAKEERYDYNHFDFEKNVGKNQEGNDVILWTLHAEKQGQPYLIPFYYHPTELEDIVAHENVEQFLLSKVGNLNTTLYITLDPDLKSKAVVAAVEISRITGSRYNILNIPTHGALTRDPIEGTASTQSPIITCEDADNNTIVIYMTVSMANFIHLEGDCIVIEGMDEENLLRSADRFAYMMLGVME